MPPFNRVETRIQVITYVTGHMPPAAGQHEHNYLVHGMTVYILVDETVSSMLLGVGGTCIVRNRRRMLTLEVHHSICFS